MTPHIAPQATTEKQDALDGLPLFHDLLDLNGHPDFHALVEEDIQHAHTHARILYSPHVLLESFTLNPAVLHDRAMLALLLRHEEERGLKWAA